MTKLMQADCEQFEWIDEVPHDGNVPESKYNYCHSEDLCNAMKSFLSQQQKGSCTYNIYNHDLGRAIRTLDSEQNEADILTHLVVGWYNRPSTRSGTWCGNGWGYWRPSSHRRRSIEECEPGGWILKYLKDLNLVGAWSR